MPATRQDVDEATAAWPLDPANPTIRRLAIGRLRLGDATDHEAPPIPDEPWVRALLHEPTRPNGDPTPLRPYQEWAGPHWRPAALAGLDVPASDPAVAPVIAEGLDRVVAWLESPGRLATATRLDGRARVHGSQEGLAAWPAVRHGLSAEPGIARAIERLVDWQWPYGGWNCDRHREASHSSFNESFAAIRALDAYARDPAAAREDAHAAGDRGAAGRRGGLRNGRDRAYQAVAVDFSAMPSLSSHRSASIAARAPSPAAVTAWR